MVDSIELQRLAKLVDMNRSRLDEINQQIERIEAVQLEHDDTRRALKALSDGKSGHIPLGAGVMIPIPKQVTTIVDLGTGIFGERTVENAEDLVTRRLEDLSELRTQFEAEASLLRKRIEELATNFEEAAKNYSSNDNESEPTKTKVEEKPQRRRRKSMGGELTLDD